jgi:predicted KAP-like P-loop ATPase
VLPEAGQANITRLITAIRGHYFRVPAEEMEKTVQNFIKSIKVNEEYVEELKKFVMELWNKRREETKNDETQIDNKIKELKASAKATAEKIKFLSSEVAIKYLEEDLIEAEKEIEQLELEKINQNKKDIDMEVIMENVAYFLEHLEELLIGSSDPLKRAAYFGLIFDIVPTYLDLTSGTPKLAPYFGLKKGVAPLSIPDGDPTRIRTGVTRMRT